jgi:protein ImuA
VIEFREKLAAARALIKPTSLQMGREKRVALGHFGVDSALPKGLLVGALHEVFAADPQSAASASGFATALTLRAERTKKILWIRQDFSALEHGEMSGSGLLELGFDPRRLVMLRAANAADALRAATDVLACGALGAAIIEVIGTPKILDLVASRKLTLAAQAKGVMALLLRFNAPPQASSAETRWLVRSAASEDNHEWGAPRFDVTLARNRHGQTGRWDMEWDCDDGLFRAPQERAAHSGAVVSAPADRPAAA